MSLRFMDSFDHYTSFAQMGSGKWDSAGVINAIVAGRTGNALSLNSNNSQRNVVKTLTAKSTWIIGFAFQWSGTAAVSHNADFVRFLDGASSVQVGLHINASGFIEVRRNGAVITGATGTTVIAQSNWYYIELKFFIDDTTGYATVKLNGVTEISVTNQDTRAFGTTADRFQLLQQSGTSSPQPTYLYDDLYVCDGDGSAPLNDFLGDCKVECKFPNGNGNSSQFVGSDSNSTDNYLLVDETTPNDDTDYVESSTVGNKDTYAMQDLTTSTGTVYGIQLVPWARKTDAGSRTFVNVVRLSATEEDSPAGLNLSSSYNYFPEIRTTKPGGGTWSISDVNSAEVGYKVAS